MSTKLGTLTLDLIAKIGNFTGPIKDAEKQSKLSFDNMRKHVNTYGTAIIGITASGATALAGMALQTANQAAELEQFALRANTTTQEFQKMAAGAGAFGIEQEKLSDMMKDFNEKLGELTAIGAGGGVDFFEKIAVKTEGSAEAAEELILKMQKLSGPEALQLYVDKLEEAGVTQQQMSFYLESMASDMTDLIPLLVNGGEGMRLYGDMAERAGIIMTDETIEAAKTLKDQVYMLDLQMQGAKNQLMQAVIPAFVDIAEAFLGGSEQGLQFSEVASGIATGLRYVAKVAIGAATSIQLVGKTIGGIAAAGSALASGDLSGARAIGSAMLSDLSATALSAAERMDQLSNSAVSATAKQLRGIRELNQNIGNTNSGLSELAAKQDKAEKATRQNTKALRDQNRVLEDARRLIYEYGSEFNRIETDLRDEILQIQGAALTSSAKTRMIADAQEVSEARKKLYASELDFELNQYRMTEAEKLEAQLNIDKLKIDATKGLLDDERKLKKASLDAQSKIEQSLTRISQDKTLLEIKRHWMTAGEYAREYYALVREEILSTPGYSPEMRDALLSQASAQQNIEESYERDSAIEDYRNVMGYGENPLIEQFEVLQKMRELDLLNEEAYQNAKLELQAKSTASYMEGMLGGFAALVDENSKTYAVLFAAQKAFAVAQAMLNIPAAYSKAYDAVVGTPYIGPYIAPAVGAAAAALQVAQAASMKSVNLTGMAHDGIDNIPKEGTWLLDGGERVLNPEQNKDLTNYLSQAQQNNSGANVNLNPNFVIVDEREKLGDYLFGPDGKKAFVKFFKQNRRELGFA